MPKKSIRKPRKNKSATRTDPDLWERVKKSVVKSPKGGPSGKWSARKAQIAVALYKKSGGRYKGKKSPDNSLVKWTREEWGYVNQKKGPGNKYGRYLPLRVREHLTASEKRTENRRKGTKQGQHIPYSESVLEKFRKYRYKMSGKAKGKKDLDFGKMINSREMIERRNKQIELYGEYKHFLEEMLKKSDSQILDLLSIDAVFQLFIQIVNAKANNLREEHFNRKTRALKLSSFPKEWKKKHDNDKIDEELFKKMMNVVLEFLAEKEADTSTSFNPFEVMEYEEDFHTIFENMIDTAVNIYETDNEDEYTLIQILLGLIYKIEE